MPASRHTLNCASSVSSIPSGVEVVLQVKAERPVWYLSVICGALLRVIEQVNLRSADYLGFLEKGQLPPARLTLTSFQQQLVLEGDTCYTLLCAVSWMPGQHSALSRVDSVPLAAVHKPVRMGLCLVSVLLQLLLLIAIPASVSKS